LQQPTCELPAGGYVAASGDNAGPWNFIWTDINGTILQTSLNSSVADTLHGLIGGNYFLNVNTVGQCDNSSTQFQIIASDPVVSSFLVSDDTIDVSNGTVIQFSNTSANAATFVWNFGDLTLDSIWVNPQHNYSTAGTYTVQLLTISAGGCKDSSAQIIVVTDLTTDVENYLSDAALKISDLGHGDYVVYINGPVNKEVIFQLYDVNGKCLLSKETTIGLTFGEKISLGNYSEGVYYLSVRIDEKSITRSLLNRR
jgi:PKD repeat protein